MHSLFTSSGHITQGAADTHHLPDLQTLPAFLRVLLTTDGTVTKSLESFFWEPVGVHTIEQAEVRCERDIPVLALPKNDVCWHRRVQLIGKHTQNCYAIAHSDICLARLTPSMQQDLKNGAAGIGELIRECQSETYREIIQIGKTPEVTLSGAHKTTSEQGFIWRTYRILMAGKPVMRITEYFPLSLYR